MTRSSTNELYTPYKDPEREFRSSRRHFKTLSLDELRSLDFNLLSDEEYSDEEEEEMAEIMEQYMSKTRTDYGSGVVRPKIDNKYQFELKGQFLKELRENTFSSSDNEDANEHIEKVLEIVDLFHVPNITVDQLMLRIFPISLTGATARWLRNELTGSIKTWEDLKTKFLNKYCPPVRTAKKMEEINNFQQESDEILYQAWERFKELLMKFPQHYLTKMQEMPKQPSKKWLNTLKNGIMEHLEEEKMDEKVYAAQVGCEQCKGPHYTKDCQQKEEWKTIEEAYYTQFGGPFQGGGYRATAPGHYQRNNVNPSFKEQRQSMEDALSKFMSKSAKIHEENSNLIKEIRASTDASIRNQGASIKTLEIQIGVSVISLSTNLNLGLGELVHTRLTVELADRTVKYPKGITKNVLVGIGKFTFPVDFIILDMPEENYIELNDLNEPFKLRRNQGNDLMPTIEECEVIEEFRTRNEDLDTGIYDHPSYCDDDKKIHIDYAHNLKFSCMIGFEFTDH
ncbi:reverse transcriptase domain-containing protein [Tanacetum coccineum]